MHRENLIRKLVEESLNNHKELQERLETELVNLPEGSLIRRKNGSLSIAVREGGRQYQIALTQDEEDLVFQLKKRRYIKAGRAKLQSWIDACTNLLEKGEVYDPVAMEEQLPEQYRGLQGLDIFSEGDVNPDDWKNEIHYDSGFFADKLVHQTPGGVRMRSKSEAMIGAQLEKRGIPYHYEAAVYCGSKRYSADFEMLPPNCRRLIYLEHLGMIDNPAYVMKNLEKLQDYARAGIVLGYNLFITYETAQQPLTLSTINKVIDEILALD